MLTRKYVLKVETNKLIMKMSRKGVPWKQVLKHFVDKCSIMKVYAIQ